MKLVAENVFFDENSLQKTSNLTFFAGIIIKVNNVNQVMFVLKSILPSLFSRAVSVWVY
jgi:hypothetical protein